MEQRSLLLGENRPSARLGVVVAVCVVAAITALIYPLREVMPAVSTGVIFLVAVLVVSTFWGLRRSPHAAAARLDGTPQQG